MSISLSQYLLYLQYMFFGILFTAVFACVYARVTPIDEFKHIRTGNVACALSFGGALVGFCITLASSIVHSVGLLDFMIWGAAAMVVQIAVFFGITRLMGSGKSLEENNMAAGVLQAAFSVGIGILNAACLT